MKLGQKKNLNDPELESLRKELDELMDEINEEKREHRKKSDEARNKHFRRKSQIEVANASMSGEQRLFHLHEIFNKEKNEFANKKAQYDLQMSEATKYLASLKAEVSSHLTHVSPEVWKQRLAMDDDEKFEQTLIKQVF
jgi:hypothetical protein